MIIIFLIILATVAAFLAWAFVRGGTRKSTPRPPGLDYEMRYLGGHPICRICGETTEYSDNYGPVHPWCREGSRVMTP